MRSDIDQAYRISNWDSLFENRASRRVANARWVPVPNKHDGNGFRRVATHERCCEVFTAWNLMLQVASKMPERGVLHDGDSPLDSEDLAMMTGFPKSAFDVAFEVLTRKKIGWLEIPPKQTKSNFPESESTFPNQSVHRKSSKHTMSPPMCTSNHQNGTFDVPEGNRREGEGIEEEKTPKPPKGAVVQDPQKKRSNARMTAKEALEGVPRIEWPENLKSSDEFAEAFRKWVEFRVQKKKIVQTPEAFFGAQLKRLSSFGVAVAIESLNNSLEGEWQGLFDPRQRKGGNHAQSKPEKQANQIDLKDFLA